MDKQTVLGFILIGLVLIVWMWLQAPPPHSVQPRGSDSLDSITTHDSVRREPAVSRPTPPPPPTDSLGTYFAGRTAGIEKTLVIKTDLYTAELSTKGGVLLKWEMRHYVTWDKLPVQLVDYDRHGDLSLLFTTGDGRLINTRNLYFDAGFADWRTIELRNQDSVSIDMVLPVRGGGSITKRFTFTNGKYSFDVDLLFEGVERVISNFEYQVIWEHGLRYAEHNSVDESGFAMAYAYSGGELTEVEAAAPGEPARRDITGATGWVATRTKYFAVALIAEEGKTQGAYLEGIRLPTADNGQKEVYSLALKMPLKGNPSERAKLTVFLGPLDFDIVKSYGRGLDQVMSLGAAWIIRPIAEYVMIPLFKVLRGLIPNYGLVIIVFSIIIKIALHPLTKTSLKSMRKMQALTPLMNEIREKHKDDPQKMNAQIMNLYKEYGVNPASGCLPLLLQMPILFALYAMFRSSIQLRQASFVWWIKDLSIPDSIAKLPFTIPIFQITEVSGLAVAMGLTTFIQQKMTTTDPRQKTMVWLMPILLTLVFNSLPSGLNLYYFVFNVLSIGQQMWITKQHGDEPLRKVDPKKKGGGIMAKLTKDLPKLK